MRNKNSKYSKKEKLSFGQKRLLLIQERKNSQPTPGEQRIIDFLTAWKIPFEREHFFPRCNSPQSGMPLFFDFYLPFHKLVIEFDGIYHYKPLLGPSRLDWQKRRDGRKDDYCARTGLKMLRIPYWEAGRVDELLGWYFIRRPDA